MKTQAVVTRMGAVQVTGGTVMTGDGLDCT